MQEIKPPSGTPEGCLYFGPEQLKDEVRSIDGPTAVYVGVKKLQQPPVLFIPRSGRHGKDTASVDTVYNVPDSQFICIGADCPRGPVDLTEIVRLSARQGITILRVYDGIAKDAFSQAKAAGISSSHLEAMDRFFVKPDYLR